MRTSCACRTKLGDEIFLNCNKLHGWSLSPLKKLKWRPCQQLSRMLIGFSYLRKASSVATIFGPSREQIVWAPCQGVTAITSPWQAPCRPRQPRWPPAVAGPSLRHCTKRKVLLVVGWERAHIEPTSKKSFDFHLIFLIGAFWSK